MFISTVNVIVNKARFFLLASLPAPVFGSYFLFPISYFLLIYFAYTLSSQPFSMLSPQPSKICRAQKSVSFSNNFPFLCSPNCVRLVKSLVLLYFNQKNCYTMILLEDWEIGSYAGL